METIRERKLIRHTEWWHDYRYRDEIGAGWHIACDENGAVDPDNADRVALLKECQSGSVKGHPVDYHGLRSHTQEYWEPRIARCDCGGEVVLQGFTCPCSRCDAEYNSGGQRLAPRHHWGEETGEHPADIAMAESYRWVGE